MLDSTYNSYRLAC